MPNQEDYLDNLLDSIQDVRHQKSKEERDADKKRQARYQERRRVRPDDDFLERTGLKDYEPKSVDRKNLKRALSEADFLKDFEASLDDDESDDFIDDFEREIGLSSDKNQNENDEIDNDAEYAGIDDDNLSDNDLDTSSIELNEESDNSSEQFETEDFFDEKDIHEDNSADEGKSEGTNDSEEHYSDAFDPEENQESLHDESIQSDDKDINEGKADYVDQDEADIQVDSDLQDETASDDDEFSLESIMARAEEKVNGSEQEGIDKSSENDGTNASENSLDQDFDAGPLQFDEEENAAEELSGKQSDDSEAVSSDIPSDEDEFSLEEPGNNMDLSEDGASADDLMSLLQGDGNGDLGEISDLLNVDSSGETLPEAEESYEENVSGVMDEPGPGDPDFAGGVEAAKNDKKPGFFQKLLSAFKKKDKSSDDTVVLKEDKPEVFSEENDQILSEMEGEEEEDPDDDGTGLIAGFFRKAKAKSAAKKEEKKNQPKKEKPKKEKPKKEKPKKAPKPPKPPKPKDTSPKISKKVIVATFLLAISIVALILLGTKMFADQRDSKLANSLFAKGESNMENYVDAYNVLAGGTYTGNEEKFYKQTAQMADIVNRIDRYNSFIGKEKYDMALNELIMAYGRAKENSAYIKKLGITDIYQSKVDIITQALSDQFNLTPDKANEIYKMSTRKKYTKAVNAILKSLGMTKKK